MVQYRSDYGLVHGFRKFLSNIKALPNYLNNILKRNKKVAIESKLVLIISFPRSGTHALASMINHPKDGLNYYGEFFIFNQWSPIIEQLNKYIPFFSWRYFLNTRRQKKNWKHYRFENTSLDPIITLQRVMAFPGTHTIKIFPEHLYLDTLKKIISEFKPHIIFLRRNHLDRYVSLKKANKSGNWHDVDSSNVITEVDENELDKYVANYLDFYRNIKGYAASKSCQILDLEFNDLQDVNKVTQIQNFVSLNENLDLFALPKQPTTKKMDKLTTTQDAFLIKTGKNYSDYDFVGMP